MTKPPFRLLYNNDNTNTCGCVSPWHEPDEPFREEMLVASIDEVAGTGVDAYLLSPGMGWVPWWQSNVEPDYYAWWQARTGLPVDGYDKYVAEGGDMVRVLVDTCTRCGMAPFVSLRINDTHHQEHYVLKDAKSLVSCRFYTEHPEWHIDPEHPAKVGYYKRRGMDWAVPEVRAYKLALLTELAENYDLAGLELDFLRDETLFRNDGPSESERIDIISDFVAQVRQALDRATPPGSRRYLCVRVPTILAAHARSGLDVQRLQDAGVDMFNLSGWFHTTQRTDVAAVRQLVAQAAIYVEMTHSTSWYPHFIKPGGYGTPGDPRTSPHQFYTTARLARRGGADGMSLFNFVYYRQGPHLDVPVMEPPFHVLAKLNDSAFLDRQAQHYMIGHCSYDRQLPKEVRPGDPVDLVMEMLGQAADQPDGRLRVHTLEPVDASVGPIVSFNGTVLERCDDASRFFGNPFDPMVSPPGHRLAWTLPASLIREGANALRLEQPGEGTVTVTYVDAGLPRRP